jgi:uncharacterized OB-fold protein
VSDVELVAPFTLAYTYKRSTGPVIGQFLTALRDRRLVGVRGDDGAVLFPPAEYDPRSGHATGAFVPVGPDGVVEQWSCVHIPRPTHPLSEPFAFAMIRLHGADVAFLHVVRAPEDALATGMAVRPVWRETRTGSILDLHCFEPAGA